MTPGNIPTKPAEPAFTPLRARFVTSLDRYGNYPGIGLPEVAVAGRSNVGKSSLINRVTGRRGLAKVSQTPGKTRLLNLFELDDGQSRAMLVDLPGYGFANVSRQEQARWQGMIEGYFKLTGTLRRVLHLVDIRHAPSREDLGMNRFLNDFRLPFAVIATKADKLSRAQQTKQLHLLARELQIQPWDIVPFSAETGQGGEKVVGLIMKE